MGEAEVARSLQRALYHLLSNPVYVGKTRHGGKLYEGQHKAIIVLADHGTVALAWAATIPGAAHKFLLLLTKEPNRIYRRAIAAHRRRQLDSLFSFRTLSADHL